MTLYSSDPRIGAIGGPTFGASGSAPAGAGPSAVNLGIAGNFAIFGDTGISNATFPAAIVGDMGVGPGVTSTAITGPWALALDGSGQFSTSAQVIGKVYAHDYAAPTPAYVTTASVDMLAAYNDAIGRAVDHLNFNAGSLDSQVLTPGVYKWTTAVTLGAGATVTISGGSNDRIILISTGAITTGAASHVVLTGGIQSKNVIWASISLGIGANATFNGIVLTSTTITVGNLATANSRLLAQTAVNIDESAVIQTAAAATPSTAISYLPFIAYARVVPVIASGRRREYVHDLEKKAQAVETALLNAGFVIATPVAFTHSFRQSPTRLTIVGFWPDNAPVAEPLVPMASVISSGTVEGEKTSVLHAINGTQTWGDIPSAQNQSQTKALKAALEAAIVTIPLRTWTCNIFYMDVDSVKYGQLPPKKGFFSFPT